MPVVLWVDAGSDTEWGGPDSKWACGAVIQFSDGFVEAAKRLPAGTVNEAEYRGMVFGLELAKRFGAEKLAVRSDSQLMIRQILGEYQCRKPHLQRLLAQVREKATAFAEIEFEWVRRDLNGRADELVRRALR
jgi:ribonuclease HI